jgi:penicillin-binding protein 2
VEVAGKTGTAQNWRLDARRVKHDDNHTWFICFAPYKDPKFAVAVLVQNGKSGGGCAAPVARRVLEQCLALDKGYQVAIEALPPAEGNFNHIASVQYIGAAVPEALNADEDGDVGTGVSTREPDGDDAPRVKTTPNIKPRADSAGSAGSNSGQNVPKAVPVRRVGIFNRGGSQETKPSDSAPNGGGFFRKLFR